MSDKYFSNELILPGETILEMMEEYGMNQKELAVRMGYTQKHVNRVIKGKSELTVDFALRLERIFGLKTSFWVNLESNYREKLAKSEDYNNIEEEKTIANDIPYAKMANLGWVEQTKEIEEKVKNLRSFFRVSKLQLIDDVYSYAFREKGGDQSTGLAQAAWIARGEILASQLVVKKNNEQQLKKNIDKMRALTLVEDPEFIDQLTQICSECGIKLVLVPKLPKTYVHGVTKWLDKNTVLIQLSLRYKYGDILWFSFFHELSHILIHGKRIINKNFNNETIEEEADLYASELLIPQKYFKKFISEKDFSNQSIKEFSERINTHPGIIVGRLMFKKYISYGNPLRELRVKYDWK